MQMLTPTEWGLAYALPDITLAGVTHRRASFFSSLSSAFSPDHTMVVMDQVHSADCAVFRDDQLSDARPHLAQQWQCDGLLPTVVLPAVDAVVTTVPSAILAVRTADCLPIIVTHPSGLRGVVHAGRQGTVDGIIRNTLKTIRSEYGLSAGFTFHFGPCISVARYQIDRETDLHYDLCFENEMQIASFLGAEDYTLHRSGLCTFDEVDLFFSYRREGAQSGRIWTFVI